MAIAMLGGLVLPAWMLTFWLVGVDGYLRIAGASLSMTYLTTLLLVLLVLFMDRVLKMNIESSEDDYIGKALRKFFSDMEDG